ncbi:MAG: hypothetical protein PHQ50_05455 [Eubacteriales bacterium]|nr:hypothetical protein [Eubacteriales bacterium]
MSDAIKDRNYMSLSEALVRQSERINQSGQTSANQKPITQGPSFQDLLNQTISQTQEQTQTVSFSKHANQRAQERNILVSESDLTKLGDACDKASEKGIKDALIMMNQSAFIVNAKNKVVITVVDQAEMRENVITNIDGAIFI